MTTPVEKENKGRFVQFPHNLIYGYSGLTRDDKWTLIAIMGLCWTDGPHRLSYRDIANMSGVPLSLLSSIEGKNGKKSKEGIIDRLERLGLIRITRGKDVDAVTGNVKGNATTYVWIEYKSIWLDNVTYCEAKKFSQVEPYKVSQDSFKPVSYTNKVVSIENNLDTNTNRLVPNENDSVLHTNEPVHTASTKQTPNILNTLQTITDNQEKRDTAHTDTQPAHSVEVSHDTLNAPLIFLSSFLATDSREKPTKLVVFMTSKKYNAEIEDDRRGWVATELKWKLEQQGHTVTLEFQQEQDENAPQIVDAFAAFDAEELSHARKTELAPSSNSYSLDTHTTHPHNERTDIHNVASSSVPRDEAIRTTNVDVVPDVSVKPTTPDVAKEVATSADENTGNKGTGRGKRVASKKKSDGITSEQKTRMTSLMDFIDSLLQEVTGDSDEGLDRKTKAGQDAIYSLLFNGKKGEQRIIPSRVKRVFTDVWNEPRNTRSGYWLRNNLSYNKFCEEFEKRIHAIIADENKGKVSTKSNEPVQMIEWKGQRMTRDEARQEGYTGFEKYVGNGPEDKQRMAEFCEQDEEVQRLLQEIG